MPIGVSKLAALWTTTSMLMLTGTFEGWAKFMQWKYPVEIVVTSGNLFKGAGAVEAAATL